MISKRLLIGGGFAALKATRLSRLTPARWRGLGAILTLHRVRPRADGFAPNALLEIEPEFLERALRRALDLGFEFVALADVPARLAAPNGRRFLALTFDDGYSDFLSATLPILERFGAPATLFVSPGMVEGGAQLWWLQLEEAVRRLDEVEGLPARTAAQKAAAYDTLYWRLRAKPEADLLAACAALAARAGVSDEDLRAGLFLDWARLRGLAANPLLSFGAHGMRHLRLAQWPAEVAREEIAASKAEVEARLGRALVGFCYPVGDRTSAAAREFALARDCGFTLGVTTRPGLLFAEHAAHTLALPRVSLNGLWQDEAYLEVLLSGAAFALWNRGRRLDVD